MNNILESPNLMLDANIPSKYARATEGFEDGSRS